MCSVLKKKKNKVQQQKKKGQGRSSMVSRESRCKAETQRQPQGEGQLKNRVLKPEKEVKIHWWENLVFVRTSAGLAEGGKKSLPSGGTVSRSIFTWSLEG